jgi:formate dehydrogenase assembly factor FdhD
MEIIKNYDGKDVQFDLAGLRPEDLESVYVGKAGRCCCGCSGRHRYASATREQAGKNRGYSVKDDEVNDRQVKKVLKIVKEYPELARLEEGSHIAVELGPKLYIVYFNDAYKERQGWQ